MSELIWHDATDLAAAIRCGELSCAELMNACYDQIEAHNPRLNAIVTDLLLDAELGGGFGIGGGRGRQRVLPILLRRRLVVPRVRRCRQPLIDRRHDGRDEPAATSRRVCGVGTVHHDGVGRRRGRPRGTSGRVDRTFCPGGLDTRSQLQRRDRGICW